MRRVVACGAVAALAGCAAMTPEPMAPLTPAQSRALVMDAAAEVVATLKLPVLRAVFWHASCNDQGQAPFRGQVRITYPAGAGAAEYESEMAGMIRRLTDTGWSADPGFHSHSPVVTKSGITAILRDRNASMPTRAVEVLGECRDVTERRQVDERPQWIDLPE